MAMPFLWMTDYDKNEDECDLNITYVYLIYIISLNIIFVVLPMIVLTYFYICIIIKSKKNYKSLRNMFTQAQNANKKSSLKLRSKSYSLKIINRASQSNSSNINSLNESTICEALNRRLNSDANQFRSLRKSSLTSIDLLFNLKAKQKFKSTAKISILTVLSFWCQVPMRLFICWSYMTTYFVQVWPQLL